MADTKNRVTYGIVSIVIGLCLIPVWLACALPAFFELISTSSDSRIYTFITVFSFFSTLILIAAGSYDLGKAGAKKKTESGK